MRHRTFPSLALALTLGLAPSGRAAAAPHAGHPLASAAESPAPAHGGHAHDAVPQAEPSPHDAVSPAPGPHAHDAMPHEHGGDAGGAHGHDHGGARAESAMPHDHGVAGGHHGDHAPAGDPGAAGMLMPGYADHAAMAEDPLMQRARTLGSGTSLLPAASPMRMWAWRTSDWLWMAHGDLVGGFNQQGGPRGASAWAAENWAMLMGTRPLGPGLVDLRAMASLEAFTLPPGGTPQLFQTGESYQGRPLLDRQHPHDVAMELSGRYTWTPRASTSLFGYAALAGEPALGPTAFMHRPSAADDHWPPLAHHLQDSTHVTYGVLTAGLRQGPFQLEGSLFNGREPDENRVGFDLGALDSWSARLSWVPSPNWTAQVSHGRLKDPELLTPGDVERTTASAQHVMAFPGGFFSNALIWGQNREHHDGLVVLQSYGAESQLDWAWRNHVYGRLELVDKAGLALTGGHDHDVHRVTALTLGGIRDIDASDAFDLGLGADATVYSLDAETRAVYGDNPFSFRVYLRLRPPTMAH